MGNRKTSGLTKRGGVWHIDKMFRGVRICESTGTDDLEKAEEQLAQRMLTIRDAQIFGVRTERTFRAAATKYLSENQHKRSIHNNALHLKRLDPFIGELPLKHVHMGSLQDFIAKRRSDGVKTKTINGALETVRRIVNLAASEWIDERGMTWLETHPRSSSSQSSMRARRTRSQCRNRRCCFRNCPSTSRAWRSSRSTRAAANRKSVA